MIFESLAERPPYIEEVEAWGQRFGEVNWGLVIPPGMAVLDVDPRSGGTETAVALGVNMALTPTCLTGGQGVHFYFQAPPHRLPAMVGPGVDVKGPGSIVVLPPSTHKSGRQYLFEAGYGLGEVPLAPWPDLKSVSGPSPNSNGHSAASRREESLPHHGNGSFKGEEMPGEHGFVRESVDAALAANGMTCPDTPGAENHLLLQLYHQGVSEGVRFLTARGLLAAARRDGATREDLDAIALAFASRCRPPYTEAEALALARWVSRCVAPWEPDAVEERSGPTPEAWDAWCWDANAFRRNARRTEASDGFPNFTGRKPVPPEEATGFLPVKFGEAVADLEGRSWDTYDPLDPLSKRLRRLHRNVTMCGRRGIVVDSQHRTTRDFRRCGDAFHTCERRLFAKLRIIGSLKHSKLKTEIGSDLANAARLLFEREPTWSILGFSVRFETPADAPTAVAKVKEVLGNRAALFCHGGLAGVKLRYSEGGLAADCYVLMPGEAHLPSSGRGRPPKYRLEVIEQGAFDLVHRRFVALADGGWLDEVVPDHLEDFVRCLSVERHSRLSAFGLLGKVLSALKLKLRCPVEGCGRRARDMGFFDVDRHELVAARDEHGRAYQKVIDKPRAQRKKPPDFDLQGAVA